jgi:hypothetical protein
MIAALYVLKDGPYYGLPDVDPWPEERDARLYEGPWPVVAHPPCQRWGRFARGIERAGGPLVGDDGDCFEAALNAVRRCGGVLEHPAHSLAFARFGLGRPTSGQWCQSGPGWICEVEQGHYGHRARKQTWLYAHGVMPPPLRWGRSEPQLIPARSVASAVARGVRPSRVGAVAVMSRRQREETPEPFRDLLLSIARTAQ